MASKKILPSQTREIMSLVVEAGFDSSDFSWQLRKGKHFPGLVSTIVYNGTDYYFLFDFKSGKPYCIYSPSKELPVIEQSPKSWDKQLPYVNDWLESLKRELEALPHSPEYSIPSTIERTVPLDWDKVIFLAHASEDKEQVRMFYDKLRDNGLEPWLDEVDLSHGAEWETEIRNAIRRSRFFIAFLSRRSIEKSGFYQKELRFALSQMEEKAPGTVYIVPALLEDIEIPDIPVGTVNLARYHAVRLFPPYEQAEFEKLVSGLKGEIEKRAGPTRGAQISPSNLKAWMQAGRNRWDSLVASLQAEEVPPQYQHGIHSLAYKVQGDFELMSAAEVRNNVREVQKDYTGWPMWIADQPGEFHPYVYDGLVECWLLNRKDPAFGLADFWRASPTGELFLLRNYREDSHRTFQPGTTIETNQPIRIVAESLLHARRMASKIAGDGASVHFGAVWEGLAGRTLGSWQSGVHPPFNRTTQQEMYSFFATISVAELASDLPRVVHRLVAPLYEIFNFYQLPLQSVERVIERLKKRQ